MDARRIVLTVCVAVAGLAAVVLLALLAGGGPAGPSGFAEGSVPPRQVGSLDRAVELAGCESSDPESEGRTKTPADVDYRADPPHSGNHAPEPAPDAAYRSDPPADENLVHSL